MKVHWFSVLSIVGVILLSKNSFGGELQWKKPMDSQAVVPSVAHIPTVITTDDVIESPAITQVQLVEPFLQPSDRDPRPSYQNPLPGATTRTEPIGSPLQVPQVTRNPLPDETVKSGPQNTAPYVPCNDPIGLLKSIKEISHDIRPTVTGELPAECIVEGKPYYGRHFDQTCYMWTASALSTKAAYFEDTQLERHGHLLVAKPFQPIVSGAKFFTTIPLLPYKMGVTLPNECVYTLGHRRADSCAPYMVEPFPISPRGALFQAGAVTGAVFAIP